MNSRERVVTVLHKGMPDRVPVDYDANPGIDRRLKAHFGLKVDDNDGLRRALGVDIHGIGPRFVGPSRHDDIPARGINVDEWGIHRRWVEHASGGYWDFCDFPLTEATEEQVAAWPLPSPDDYDYNGVAEQCRRLRCFALHVGGAGTLQPEATNMSPEYLKRTFGGRLAFHGCISTAEPLASGTVKETVACCRRTLEIMMPGGGYCFAPTHQIQDNTPTANVVAMYELVKTHGVYR